MYIEVNFSKFCDAFRNMERDNQFSYEAKRIIFDFIEDYERDSGEETELDVIALCCDIAEMTETEVREYYNISSDRDVSEYLENRTTLLGEFKNTDETVYIFHQF